MICYKSINGFIVTGQLSCNQHGELSYFEQAFINRGITVVVKLINTLNCYALIPVKIVTVSATKVAESASLQTIQKEKRIQTR